MLDDAGQADWIDPDIAPNIANFRNSATLFPAFYTAPMCAPTRLSLLSGRSHVDYSMLWVCGSDAIYGIPNSDATIPQSLAKRGYTTSTFGKWHASVKDTKKAAKVLPIAAEFGADQKFDYHMIPGSVVADGYYRVHQKKGSINTADFNGSKGKIDTHKVDFTADKVIEKIRQYKNASQKKPFYLQYWLNAPHTPLQPAIRMFTDPAQKEEYKRYKNAVLNKTDKAFQKEYLARNARLLYEKLLAQADENIGRVLDELKKNDPYLQNTIIMITSDNGGLDKTRKPGNNYGNHDYKGRRLRGFKTDVFEGGIRQNLIVKMPGQMKGRVDETPLTVMDLFPTYLDLIDSPPYYSESDHFDGVSFKKRLVAPYEPVNRKSPIFTTFKVQNEHVKTTVGNDSTNWAIRKGRWKLVREVHAGCTPCLFDFSSGYNDESLSNNLADRFPEVVSQLKEEYIEWFLTSTQLAANPKRKSKGVRQSDHHIPGFKKDGPSELVRTYEFSGTSGKKYVELDNNYKFDVNRLDFSFTAKVKIDRFVPGKWQTIAMRKGTWMFRLNPQGRLQVVVFDKNGLMNTTTATHPLKTGVAHDVGFSLYSFKSLGTVVRIYARGTNKDTDGTNRLMYLARNETFKGLKSNNNTIFLGADPNSTQTPLLGTIESPRLYHSPLRATEMGYSQRWWGNRYD